MNSNLYENLRIIYPDNVSSIITRLMEKYGLKETEENFLDKLLQGEMPTGGKVARIIAEVVENNFSLEEISSIIEQDLNLSKNDAYKFAEDIKKEILDFVKKVSLEETPEEKIIEENKFIPQRIKSVIQKETSPKEKKTSSLLTEKKEIKKSSSPDEYREPVE
jgi:hypothetical protein